jgi:hypothetical protein
MKRFVEGEERRQTTLFPDCVEDYVAEGLCCMDRPTDPSGLGSWGATAQRRPGRAQLAIQGQH